MAVLSREDFLARVRSKLSDELNEDDIAFIEDMTDTYDDLNGRIGEDWRAKYDALDREWREKYVERFNSGSGIDFVEDSTGDVEEAAEEEFATTYEELFTDYED